ncbi:S41 family peptidase [Lentisphaerota bacterium ZTH]|nr:hypothetical protein JYG24_08130 [Lentisphaerota bacterium]WET06539.1 S41 family peptidase [Lentisphaerota bacterium ZTH]
MRKLLTAGLTFLAMFFNLQAEDSCLNSAVSDSPSNSKKPQVAKQLATEMQQLFTLLKQQNKLFKPAPVMRRRYDIMNMVAKEVSPLLEVSETPFINKKHSKSESEVFPVLFLENNTILYIRIDGATDSAFKSLNKTIDCSKMEACILDLRKCSNGSAEAMLKILGMFINESNVVTLQRQQNLKFSMPKFVLVGPDTSGTGELLAASLRKARNVVMLGEPTGGHPFHYKQFQLKSGAYVNIPQLPECMKRIPHFPVKPEVLSSPQPQTAFKILKTTGKFRQDPSIAAAVDLYKALQVTRDI